MGAVCLPAVLYRQTTGKLKEGSNGEQKPVRTKREQGASVEIRRLGKITAPE